MSNSLVMLKIVNPTLTPQAPLLNIKVEFFYNDFSSVDLSEINSLRYASKIPCCHHRCAYQQLNFWSPTEIAFFCDSILSRWAKKLLDLVIYLAYFQFFLLFLFGAISTILEDCCDPYPSMYFFLPLYVLFLLVSYTHPVKLDGI